MFRLNTCLLTKIVAESLTASVSRLRPVNFENTAIASHCVCIYKQTMVGGA